MTAAPAPPVRPARTGGRLRRTLSASAVVAFVVTGILTLFGGATSAVRAAAGEADLWLPAAPADAPPVARLSPRLSSDGYSLVHVGVSGVSPESLAVHTAVLLTGYVLIAGVAFFLAYLSWRFWAARPLARGVVVGLGICSGALMTFSAAAPLLFTLAHRQIFAELAVDLAAAPFSAVDTFGLDDAVLFFAGLSLGLLALALAAVRSLVDGGDGPDRP